MDDLISDKDYRALAGFRRQLRTFLSFSEDAAVAAGITAQQHQALLALRASPDLALPVGELADQLRLRPHSASGLIDRLEKLDLVRRTAGTTDRRSVTVVLTPAGANKIAALALTHRGELRRLRPLLLNMLSDL
ncbi:MarR family transcriptional regulator [Sphingomonas sp. RRHST34]|uniref:MarR family transcriptional regulator n=1 Tax=Sphingomonas citri TaxID=2862499 RepID=A0ABS7BSS8_9SPHN|nr:MarR family transcriptional regulator [Sphingomonas citri]MBW6532657.1 MarR family transcriptional regulator [Sphingomonas citri]